MTLRQVSKEDIQGIIVQCKCGDALLLRMGERLTCLCGKEYYCDFSFRIWENVVRVALPF